MSDRWTHFVPDSPVGFIIFSYYFDKVFSFVQLSIEIFVDILKSVDLFANATTLYSFFSRFFFFL